MTVKTKAFTLMLPVLACAFGFTAMRAAPAAKAIVIAQPNSPIEVVSYVAGYQRRSGAIGREGIRHSLEYRNKSTQKVTAIRFGLVSFDVFNRFLDKTGGVTLDDLEPDTLPQKGECVATALSDFSFLTGLAYVDSVRFMDGTIWQADEAVVLAEIRKLEKDFDAKLLKETRPPSK